MNGEFQRPPERTHFHVSFDSVAVEFKGRVTTLEDLDRAILALSAHRELLHPERRP